MPEHRSPVTLLQERYRPESYVGDEYMPGAVGLLAADGWLARTPTEQDLSTAGDLLDELYGFGLDVTDVHPFGAVWALRVAGVIAPSADVDADLLGWRRWEEGDHIGEPLTFLPDLRPAGADS